MVPKLVGEKGKSSVDDTGGHGRAKNKREGKEKREG